MELVLKIENTTERIMKDANSFLNSLFDEIEALSLNIEMEYIDHLCYRVKTDSEYTLYKKEFSESGKLLIESVVGGRLISSFKLNSPIKFKDYKIDVIELPAPKVAKAYTTGFEHAEFVIMKSFEEVINTHPSICFDTSGINKKHNPELRLKLNSGKSIKFHHDSLENIILLEKKAIST
jgi:predicted metalloenzyme YecM